MVAKPKERLPSNEEREEESLRMGGFVFEVCGSSQTCGKEQDHVLTRQSLIFDKANGLQIRDLKTVTSLATRRALQW
jgi:hypothetical protein